MHYFAFTQNLGLTQYYGLLKKDWDINHNGRIDPYEAAALYSTKRDCQFLLDSGYAFSVHSAHNTILKKYLNIYKNMSISDYNSSYNVEIFIMDDTKDVKFEDPGKKAASHKQWYYLSNNNTPQKPWQYLIISGTYFGEIYALNKWRLRFFDVRSLSNTQKYPKS